MKVGLIGNYSGNADEGMKVVANRLAKSLSADHELLKIDVFHLYVPQFWRTLSTFSPDILHYVSGPSPLSFLITRSLEKACEFGRPGHKVATVMTATQPWLPLNTGTLMRWIRPDLLLVQSTLNEHIFQELGFNVRFLPNGVDLERFRPTDKDMKSSLRNKYGIRENDFVILHVGPVRANRGLDILRKIAKIDRTKVLIIGSTSSPFERAIYNDLLNSGCQVKREFIRSIQEFYQLADLYVFPVEDSLGCIDTPLSVLEAMACNLPVVTTRFGALPRLLQPGSGLFFAEAPKEIPRLVESIMTEPTPCVDTRSQVNPYSWDNITHTLSQYYRELGNNA